MGQSLGTRCLTSNILEMEGLRKYAGPLDWIYSSTEMVIDCLGDKFSKLLRKDLLTKAGNYVGHKTYGPMLQRGVIFPHHDPRTKDRERFQKRVKRFLKVLQMKKRKLFVLCDLVSDPRRLDKVIDVELEGNMFYKLFDVLCKMTTNFELLVVIVALDSASQASRSAMVRSSIITRSKGNARLHVDKLDCIGSCTGLRLK